MPDECASDWRSPALVKSHRACTSFPQGEGETTEMPSPLAFREKGEAVSSNFEGSFRLIVAIRVPWKDK